MLTYLMESAGRDILTTPSRIRSPVPGQGTQGEHAAPTRAGRARCAHQGRASTLRPPGQGEHAAPTRAGRARCAHQGRASTLRPPGQGEHAAPTRAGRARCTHQGRASTLHPPGQGEHAAPTRAGRARCTHQGRASTLRPPGQGEHAAPTRAGRARCTHQGRASTLHPPGQGEHAAPTRAGRARCTHQGRAHEKPRLMAGFNVSDFGGVSDNSRRYRFDHSRVMFAAFLGNSQLSGAVRFENNPLESKSRHMAFRLVAVSVNPPTPVMTCEHISTSDCGDDPHRLIPEMPDGAGVSDCYVKSRCFDQLRENVIPRE
jgi:hypothetical protein